MFKHTCVHYGLSALCCTCTSPGAVLHSIGAACVPQSVMEELIVCFLLFMPCSLHFSATAQTQDGASIFFVFFCIFVFFIFCIICALWRGNCRPLLPIILFKISAWYIFPFDCTVLKLKVSWP